MNEITSVIRGLNDLLYNLDPYEYRDQYGDPETDGLEMVAAEYYRDPDEMLRNVLLFGLE